MEDNARHNFEKLIKDLESDVARGDVQFFILMAFA